MREKITVVYKNGRIEIKGNMTTKHIDDTLRELKAVRLGLKNSKRKNKISFTRKLRRFIRNSANDLKSRAESAICYNTVGSEEAAEQPYIRLIGGEC